MNCSANHFFCESFGPRQISQFPSPLYPESHRAQVGATTLTPVFSGLIPVSPLFSGSKFANSFVFRINMYFFRVRLAQESPWEPEMPASPLFSGSNYVNPLFSRSTSAKSFIFRISSTSLMEFTLAQGRSAPTGLSLVLRNLAEPYRFADRQKAGETQCKGNLIRSHPHYHGNVYK